MGKMLKMANLRQHSIQVHVSFLSHYVETRINEALLEDIFSAYGKVLDCVVKQYSLLPEAGKQSGYAFVFYESMEAVDAAIAATKDHNLVQQIQFECTLSHDSHHRLKQQYNQQSQPQHFSHGSADGVPPRHTVPTATTSAAAYNLQVPPPINTGVAVDVMPAMSHGIASAPPHVLYHSVPPTNRAPSYVGGDVLMSTTGENGRVAGPGATALPPHIMLPAAPSQESSPYPSAFSGPNSTATTNVSAHMSLSSVHSSSYATPLQVHAAHHAMQPMTFPPHVQPSHGQLMYHQQVPSPSGNNTIHFFYHPHHGGSGPSSVSSSIRSTPTVSPSHYPFANHVNAPNGLSQQSMAHPSATAYYVYPSPNAHSSAPFVMQPPHVSMSAPATPSAAHPQGYMNTTINPLNAANSNASSANSSTANTPKTAASSNSANVNVNVSSTAPAPAGTHLNFASYNPPNTTAPNGSKVTMSPTPSAMPPGAIMMPYQTQQPSQYPAFPPHAMANGVFYAPPPNASMMLPPSQMPPGAFAMPSPVAGNATGAPQTMYALYTTAASANPHPSSYPPSPQHPHHPHHPHHSHHPHHPHHPPYNPGTD
jgi:hypothetical protein